MLFQPRRCAQSIAGGDVVVQCVRAAEARQRADEGSQGFRFEAITG
jgi:hypothetical protein